MSAEPATADTFLKTVLRTGPVVIMGQEMPGHSDTSISWISDGRAYQDHGDGTAALYVAGDSTYYLIDHDNRSVLAVDLAKEVSFSAMMGGELPDTNEAGLPLTEEERNEQVEARTQMDLAAKALMQSATVEVEATGETKTIGDWETKKYTLDLSIAGMQSKGELWVTPAAPDLYRLFQQLAYSQLAASPGFHRLLDELSEVEGVTVYSKSTMTIMSVNVEVETELLDMSEAEAPEGIYELPDEYDFEPGD